MIEPPIAILKSLWSRLPNGRWGATDLKGLTLTPRLGSEPHYFAFEGELELMTNRPSANIHEMFASFGSTDFLVKQSIVPIVAWNDGDHRIRCIGTGSIVSCSGYVVTAAHVITDPYDSGYGLTREGRQLRPREGLNFGVLIPLNPARVDGFRFHPFERYWIWADWKESPLITEKDRTEYLTDVAVCKITGMPDGAAHQPLNISLNPFVLGEAAYAIGYAEIEDIPVKYVNGRMIPEKTAMTLYVSIGKVLNVFPQNHIERNTTTPGPCFDFEAKIPGRMSGAPVFGAEGAIIRGVVSRSFSDERHASGSMLGPAMHLPLSEPSTTLRTLMESGTEGIARVQGVGL